MNNNVIQCSCSTKCSGLTIEHTCSIKDHVYCDKEHKIVYIEKDDKNEMRI